MPELRMTLPYPEGRGAERTYRVTFRGGSYVYRARSRSAARYASWKALREAGYRMDLPTFAGLSQIEAVAARRLPDPNHPFRETGE